MPHPRLPSACFCIEEVYFNAGRQGVNMATTRFFQGTVQRKGMWIFILAFSCFITVRDCKEVTQLRGQFGGEVAFRCPVDKHRKIQMLYLQKGEVFVNGFYGSEDMQKHNPWPNSRVDRQQNIVYMSGLNISHSGVYRCLFEYDGNSNVEGKDIELIITANYSEPSVQVVNRTDTQGLWLVQCSSNGGYPKAKLMWNGVEESTDARAWSIVERNEVTDKYTELFNISSVAAFNCSRGELQNISCFVHGITTYFSICEQESAPTEDEPTHIEAATIILSTIGAVALIVMPVLGWCYCKYKKKNGEIVGNQRGNHVI